MPFHGYVAIAEAEAAPAEETITLVRWHVDEGSFVPADTRIASFRAGEEEFSLIICFPAMIQQRLVAAGSTIPRDSNVLCWVADGESIPYGKSYVRVARA